jgi:predicted metal-dependent HD superfamily phosphohydrolase
MIQQRFTESPCITGENFYSQHEMMEFATRQRWMELVEFLGADRNLARRWFERLEACYTEAHRRYHTMQHLEECLEELDEIEGDEERLALLEVALWFHDTVCDPGSHNNALASAALAKEFLLECQASESVVEFVKDMIMATKDHRAQDDPDAAIMIALDLNIFARSPQRYLAYEKQVREECSSLPEESYRAQRITWLQTFLDHPVIYESETMREIYEEQARFNLEQRIAQLR